MNGNDRRDQNCDQELLTTHAPSVANRHRTCFPRLLSLALSGNHDPLAAPREEQRPQDLVAGRVETAIPI